MTVLHLYPKGDTAIAPYVSMLAKAMPAEVEPALTADAQELARLCKAQRPDIIHLHGNMACRLPRGPRLVVTPHGQSHPQHAAYVLVARSPMECERLKSQHQERIEIVRNPLITRTTSAELLGREMTAVYQKVMDSNPIELMGEQTLLALRILLKAGICGDKRWVERQAAEWQVEATEWRKLFIYAEHEGVGGTLRRGLTVLGIDAPAIDATHIPVYLPTGYQKPMAATGENITELAAQPVTLRSLVCLHYALMQPKLDEDILLSELAASKLTRRFACLLQLLSEQTLLDEGFMPCAPADTKETEKMRRLLNQHQQI